MQIMQITQDSKIIILVEDITFLTFTSMISLKTIKIDGLS